MMRASGGQADGVVIGGRANRDRLGVPTHNRLAVSEAEIGDATTPVIVQNNNYEREHDRKKILPTGSSTTL